LGCHDKELSILFTDDNRMAQLNDRYLGRKGPTNVLAFPMSDSAEPDYDSAMLGDVVISVNTALRESKALGEPLEYTVDRLLIHGVLHLLDFDHTKSEEEAVRMEKEEKRLMELIMEEK
jgi:rRNA maturation RNase YbeY